MDFSGLKLVIWDLDETFWQGTLSEGPVSLKEENCELVKRLVDRGVMNSICSKNDLEPVREELESHGMWDSFVFPSVDWTPKAPRIADIIKTMSLRPVNVLFIDDNIMNLKEAQFYLKDLNVMHVDQIGDLIAASGQIGKDDSSHSRLKQYRVLEKKVEEKKEYESTNDFLKQSGIKLDILRDCELHISRIHELVGRTNQLNFTKLRSSAEELRELMSRENMECAAISVRDKYGDYGIVGFYALDKGNNTLVHFLFSCRTIGMGIEQYVYQRLGFPKLQIVGDVASRLEKDNVVDWINNDSCAVTKPDSRHNGRRQDVTGLSILLKGPCDMSSILPYLEGESNLSIDTEFNYVDENGVSITAMNHTSHLVESYSLAESDLNALLKDAPFLNRGAFSSRIISERFDFIFMSMLPDSHEGVYRHKSTGALISFSSFNYNLTDPEQWEAFISGKHTNHNFKFTREILKKFCDKFEFVGALAPEKIAENVRYLLENVIPEGTRLVLLLGSEIECESQVSLEFANHALRHKEVNEILMREFKDDPRVDFINITDEIQGQADFVGVTNHFRRRVYYNLAERISEKVSAESADNSLKVKNPAVVLLREYARKAWKKLFRSGL